MSHVRGTIETLTKILKENGCSKIRAEIFRQAKFNQDEAVPGLWRLLFELLYFCQYGTIDEVAIRAYAQLSQDELVTYVKTELQHHGFRSYEFCLLPTSMGHGSRELLLAIGWLMCREHVIDRFINAVTSPLDEDSNLELLPQENGGGECSPYKAVSNEFRRRTSMVTDPHEKIDQLLWLNNKLQLNLRNLLSFQKQNNNLTHKIHTYTEGVSMSPDRNHLTPMEVTMLRHPDLLKKNLQLLEKDNERLQNLLGWKDHEDIFWKWMESVLDAKLAEEAGEIVSASSPGDNIPPASSAAGLRVSHDKLQSAINKYESMVDHLEALWETKSESVTEEELDSLLASIDLELSIQRANISLSNTNEYVEKHQQQRWQLGAPPPQGGGGDGAARMVEEELAGLKDLVNKMNKELESDREKYRRQLDDIGQRLEGTVVIPPMNIITA